MGKNKKSQQQTDSENASRSDLSSLSNPTNENISSCLQSRHDLYKIYTNIGSRHLLAVNPLRELAINDDQTSLEYVAAYKDASGQANTNQLLSRLDPHLFDLINRVYFHMRRTGSDQNIILRGESGSGKSEIRKLTIRHLVRLSSHKKESKVQQQIVESQKVLDAFGQCQTSVGINSSRFGYYGEIQFNERGRMIGSKTLSYFLEKTRVTGQLSGVNEGNFNIFYYLLAGASSEEKGLLQLTSSDPSSYTFLSKYKKRAIQPDDATRFEELRVSLKTSGFRKEQIGRMIQLLATILHLGNLVFVDPAGTGKQEAAFVKNTELLEIIADFMGLDAHALENVLTFKTTMIRKDVTTLILNAKQAAEQRDDLCQVLYSLLFSWIVERINSKTCQDEFNSFIGVLDFPSLQHSYSIAGFHQLCVNIGNERIQQYLDQALFQAEPDIFRSEGVQVPEFDINTSVVDLLSRPKGVCDTINTMTDVSKRIYTDSDLMDSLVKYNSTHSAFSTKSSDTSARLFTISHYDNKCPIDYSTDGFVTQNNSQVSVDFVSIFKGGADIQPSWNAFLVDLFANIKTESHPKMTSAIIAARQSAKPTRAPSQRRSTRRKGGDEKKNSSSSSSSGASTTVIYQTQSALDELVSSFEEVKLWTISCILPNQPFASKFDSKFVQTQLDKLKITSLLALPTIQYVESYNHQEFLERYGYLSSDLDPSRLPRSQCEAAAGLMNWSTNNMYTTQNKVFLSAMAWRELEDQLRSYEKTEQRQAKEENLLIDSSDNVSQDIKSSSIPQHPFAATAAAIGLPLPSHNFASQHDDQGSYYSEDESGQYHEQEGSYYGSESYAYSLSGSDQKNGLGLTTLTHQQEAIVENLDENAEDQSTMTSGRKRWLFFVYFCTWWIPSKFMIWCGRMKRKDVRIAWREKFTLCMLIFLMCAFVIWFLVFFSEMVCPKQNVFSTSELQSHGTSASNKYVAIRGEVFNLGNFAPHHYPPNLVPTSSVMSYAGTDATALFPIQVSALCQNSDGSAISPYISFDYNLNLTDKNAVYHDFTYSSDDYDPNWYYDQLSMLRSSYKVGNMAFEPKAISDQAKGATLVNGVNTIRTWASIDGRIYDLTSYVMGGRFSRGPPGQAAPNIDTDFLNPLVVSLFQQQAGGDISSAFNSLSMDADTRQRSLVCLRNMFYVGDVDTRNSTKCLFSTYLLLAITVFLCAVIVFKFAAAVRFGGKRAPEEHDKFVICQVTCYTEDKESLQKTIDSLACLEYDDKRKLLFVICDGMIVGSGNDLPTPRIVLDILGVDNQVDPEALSFVSVGEGSKQHNMGKIYSGLYEVKGHVVPYIVVVKCGNPRERQKPGNRGKRDSQLIIMNFLNRVFYDAPMNPLQLEIYHQMKNVIGVDPHFYEFTLMVDADTEVMKDGLNQLVSSCVLDSKIIGVCGETTLSNENDSWVTMIQVYEYFISHHMIKSFESLFSTVSCLPGCFTMYRIQAIENKKPVKAMFCSNDIIADYSINVVDTLHKKNLLHLGEDRYLTTLLLKHFPTYKTKFNRDAQCQTNAPDMWSVLISQRRRWINSTVHNLGELVFLPRLCGFCCFSMRFIVMLDLISTLVMPAVLGYLGYLIYTLSTNSSTVPWITVATIAGTYGLQALLFIMMGKWQFILWMLVSILAMPIFSFYIPLYSYWHFDDFSWGNTRVVVGEKGKKYAVTADEGTFDPKSIPTMKWSQYEQSLLTEENYSDNMSQGSSSGYTHYSHRSGNMRPGYGRSGTPSMYNSNSAMMMNNGSSDNMSMYSQPMMMNDQRMSYGPQSMMVPSSASMPLMPMSSGRSMASFAPAPQQYFSNEPGQYIAMQQSMHQPSHNDSRRSIMTDGFTMGNDNGPRNEEIAQEVQYILQTADLSKVTKKQVRQELEAKFGVSMVSRKDYINACIEDTLNHRT